LDEIPVAQKADESLRPGRRRQSAQTQYKPNAAPDLRRILRAHKKGLTTNSP
jgi:hypothetical protein